MNTHKVLSQYHGTKEYPAIASAAAKLLTTHPDMAEDDLLAWAERMYPRASVLHMRENAAPLTVFGEDLIETGAFQQMYQVLRLPVAVRGSLMPDAHQGYAMPIGGVAVLHDAVSPSFVGYDISCMMYMTIYNITHESLLQNRDELANALRGVTSFGKGAATPAGQGHIDHAVMEDPRWESTKILKQLKPLAQRQVGSSGGGNHFADLMEVTWRDGRQETALLTHSGSRGAGHKLATHYVEVAKRETARIAKGIPAGYEWLDIRSEAGLEYMEAMQLMGRYALANHEAIHASFAEAIGVNVEYALWNRHNYAWQENDGVVHRKGATPAGKGQQGIIPGSSGTPSYVVRGKGNAASINSSSHGAGRPFSRTEAKRRHDEAFVQQWMADADVQAIGLSPDETFMAYKDIDAVMDAQADLVEVTATLVPRVVIMGGQSDDGD